MAEYDPTEREQRGVYYTPEAVVSYIVRSLNIILKEHFDRGDGLASGSVTVLDPAAGTLTFLAEASKLAVQEFISKYGEGGKKKLIEDHILKNFYAFELMMAPYAVGHLKMSFLLEELGYKLQKDERFKFYLTNTLEMEELEQTSLPGMFSLAEESHLAGEVKKETPILVILGNPPYSGHSFNVGQWISKEIRTYYEVDGKALGERNPKWLQDDYVKFIRFSQWKIDQAGEGILGFITNHSYLDNPTFRGMRQSLMTSFDEIYVLDLHGNSLKKEKCPDGSKDENVFDIRQGVAIALFIKKKGLEKKVLHSERWRLREDKYNWLLANDVKTTKWQEIHPKSEFYLFIPRDEKLLDSYSKYPKVTDVFPVNSVGVVTSRDSFVIDFEEEALKRRIFYHDEVIERPRKEVMRHMMPMMPENLGLLTKRQGRREPYSYVFCSGLIAESCVFESAFANNTVCPLYLYPAEGEMPSEEGRSRNLNLAVVKSLTEAYGKEPIPEAIFYYIYGILYSNTYRAKYAEFLKMDFPRVPFTKDYNLFTKIGGYGRQLCDLHLMKEAELDNPIAKFQGSGDSRVEKVRYSQEEKRVYINKVQYFESIDQDTWEYQIGGYQVLDKWLKDRKGRALSLDDIKHYCKIATALKKTIEIQKGIDSLYPDIEAVAKRLILEQGKRASQ